MTEIENNSKNGNFKNIYEILQCQRGKQYENWLSLKTYLWITEDKVWVVILPQIKIAISETHMIKITMIECKNV